MRRAPFLATTLLVLVPLTGCSGGDSTAGRPDDEGSSASAPGQDPGDAPVEEPAAPTLTIGDQSYVPPCSLLPPSDAARLLPLTNGAEVTERGRGASATDAELAERKDTVSGAVIETSCDYSIGDEDRTYAKLRVEQYPTESAATAQWRKVKKFGDGKLPPDLADNGGVFDALEQATVDIIRDGQKSFGGVRLRGMDRRILWQQGTQTYIATAGNLLLHFTRGRAYGLTADLTERDAGLAERVLTTALERAEELHGEDAEPAVGSTGQMGIAQAEDWPTFLDPCVLLDAEAVDTLFPGVELEELTSDSTPADPGSYLTMDSFAGRSVQNGCLREDVANRHTAELFVQYVAPGDQPKRVLDSYLSQRAYGDPRPTPDQVTTIRGALRPGGMSDVDASYVLVSTGGGWYFYAIVDRYVLELKAEQAKKTKKRRGDRSDLVPELDTVDSYTLKTAMDLVVANARSQLGTEE
ncbi:hypothetical protein ASG88_06640 [Nocardioides sp. Soil777]|uniref:hypothetical protein n=1 Tax=Nocardioides sp. Soil777 TaxID=1736409 RepID=UPI0007031697|nr:hypothetical protein [Nocardioides sp. Soil777]KRF03019.1 hypothetical protein ASG88_06640 [Nocardioides sp. Soil777]